jgi:translocation and assembly module TamA
VVAATPTSTPPARARHPRPGRRRPLASACLGLVGALLGIAAPLRAAEVSVKVDGVKGAVRDNVLATLAIAHAGSKPTADRIRQLHGQATHEIELALQPFGYYKPQVDGKLDETSADHFVARYTIEPGPLLRLEGVDLEITGAGAGDPGFRLLARRFPLRRGDAVLHPVYEAGRQSLVDYAAQHGYLEATFVTHEIRIDLAAYTARIRVTFHTGPQYVFGDVRFDDAMLDPDLLYGYLPFKTGEPFDLSKLLRLQTALASTPYFRRVEVIPEEDEAKDLKVPIHVLLVPARRERISLGLGYGPDTGVRTSVGYDVRRVNSRGHRAETTLNLSQVQQRFVGTYIVPKAIALTDFTTFSAGYDDNHSVTDKHKTALLSVGLDRARGRWRQHLDLAWQRETFDVGPDHGQATLLMPEASMQLIHADNVLYPLSGRKIQLQLRVAKEGLVSDVDLVQGIAQAKYVQHLFGPVRGLARVRLGYTSTSDFHDLPSSLRFFAGGVESVRGYGYQELTPRTPEGLPTGGDLLVETSFEADALFFQFRSYGRFGGAVFYDAGNALMASQASNVLSQLKTSTGAGLRWLSPVGLVRIDAAFALDEPGHPLRFEFSLGPDL